MYLLVKNVILSLTKYKKMITKTHLISTLDKLPENLTVDQVIDHLIFIEKVQKGLMDSEKGFRKTEDEAKEILTKWLK